MPAHSQTGLAQSLVGTLFLHPCSWYTQGFVCAKSLFPQSCASSVIKLHWPLKSNCLGVLSPLPDPQIGKPVVGPRTFLTVRAFLWFNCSAAVGRLLGSSIVGPMATSSNRAYATCSMTHICCGQSPCPCSRPLLIHASTGDALKRRSGSVSVGSLGPGAPKVLSEPSKRL